ncbi:Fe-S cluster assembly protein SufB [Candidatus Peregrinibacteria bacterium CG10_big_fil_rev_8_21_14_0_10_49_24]|nr:MAG: Fe-S cluster assembly protein SufB [Candidatus Peregrinibacteria bacterium CG11_big_fil_rev_8_21_14_0_20_49_14]PIR50518.1 MAG: Fe-S cluster assembly protein SufB [Candidatus Peregrinibacteria bacterium CG10_big_fil_rev_8_21_14_0_10_49_24]PJA67807.1 MAG: Fe-S cluster assembly protein SufB [Candidatus Peregrinibacteria bacterium CG_4_9_14_3_um_filter_49_12]
MTNDSPIFSGLDRSVFDDANPSPYADGLERGVSEELVRRISTDKNEPEWMLAMRLESLRIFLDKPMPSWGPDLSALDLDNIIYYARPGTQETDNWDEVPAEIRSVYDRLGIPEAERRMLAGVGAQYESEMVYHNLKEKWEEKGVIFLDMDNALQEHPDLVKKYFMQCVPALDHKFAALHGAVWSGGTFLYVPAGVHIADPLQAYFRMNAKNMGQFEHTLIVVEEEAVAHYIEGCSAPKYGSQGLHAGLVEIFAKPGSKVRYSSVENWSRDTYNLNTKRAIVERDATMEWIGGNMGSGTTMLYPCSVLVGEGARCDHMAIAFANEGQWQDTGAKVLHMAPHTSSKVVSKSISKGGGCSVYRGMLKIAPHAHDCIANVECDALLLDERSRTDTIPDIQIRNNDVTIAHEATVGKLSEEDIFYLTSRGIPREEAKAMIVNAFIEPVVRLLPLEYAVEMNRLIELEMEGSVG